ncbi:MAG TPA: glycosyltransferase family 4 protein [Solirubrobacteraceae bacterium]|jgi:glycosyltransferase involved in cell wall biosynthesis|nr:glycosyltransferase family 4 protein [Solirubrobacteraceae bacterium]
MRLIHLADYGGAYPGSFIPMLRAVLDGGRRRGWEVEAVFSDVARDRAWLGELRDEGISCRLAPKRRRALAQTVEEVASAGGAAILHTHFTAFDLPAARAARRDRQVIAYWHLHSALRTGTWWQLRNAVKLGLLSRGVEEILCVAPNILDQARARLAPGDRLALVENAIDLTRFPLVSEERRREARASLGLPADAQVVLHFGWDWLRKGGDIFLQAVSLLLAHGELDRLVAVTVADEQAVSAAERLGIAEHVRVVKPSDDVQALYAAADVFAAPSRGEGHPFAVAEALASGLPVVASPIPGHEMIAKAAAACRIVELDSRAFADGVLAALSLPERERERERLAARSWVVEEMDIVAWSERMLKRYDRALALRD